MAKIPTKHRLLNPKIKLCKCGNYFEVGRKLSYCSKECLKKYGGRQKWERNRVEFNREHPELCPECGCNTSKEKFRRCSTCRRKGRNYQSCKKRLKSNLTPSPDTPFNKD